MAVKQCESYTYREYQHKLVSVSKFDISWALHILRKLYEIYARSTILGIYSREARGESI